MRLGLEFWGGGSLFVCVGCIKEGGDHDRVERYVFMCVYLGVVWMGIV